jgi:SpoVK/Ycf46/Vps4 family AAA+-type ATPase
MATRQCNPSTVAILFNFRLTSRFERRIFIPLPEVQARTKMFELNVGDTPNNVTHKEFRQLGEMTEGYSGSDIAIAVRDALMEPIRKLRMATHFKPVLVLPLLEGIRSIR